MLHPETINQLFNVFNSPGGLFDAAPSKFQQNTGRWAAFINPTCGQERCEAFQIIGIQNDHWGKTAYRGVSDSDVKQFGRVMSFNKVEIFQTKEAAQEYLAAK